MHLTWLPIRLYFCVIGQYSCQAPGHIAILAFPICDLNWRLGTCADSHVISMDREKLMFTFITQEEFLLAVRWHIDECLRGPLHEEIQTVSGGAYFVGIYMDISNWFEFISITLLCFHQVFCKKFYPRTQFSFDFARLVLPG